MLSNIDLCLPSFTTFNQHRHFHSEKEKISQLINIICILFRDQRTKFVDRDWTCQSILRARHVIDKEAAQAISPISKLIIAS